jgi:PAS domain S-box-containing protein
VIVDDAADVRLLVKTQLGFSGRFKVVGEGSDGTEAIAAALAYQPDLVLLDVSMPRMDGLEALPQIRDVSPTSTVVMYTGFDDTALAERARRLGAAALIEKSFPLDRLAEELDAICSGHAVAEPRPDLARRSPAALDDSVLGEHLERFREVFEEAAIGMATMTLTGYVVRANKALASVVGRPLADLAGIRYADLADDQSRDGVVRALEAAQAGTGDVVQFEHSTPEAERLVLATAAPVRDSNGRPLYLFLQVQDVSAQRGAEAALRQSEERFRLLVEAVQDYAIFMLDPTGVIASWNAGAQRIKGYTAADAIGRHFRMFYPPHQQAIKHPEHELELALANGHYEEEGWRVRNDGTRFWANVLITAVHNENGEHIGYAKVTRDIEQRRLMQLELEQAAEALTSANEDLAAANRRLSREAADQAQFLAVTAHELRSPVTVVSGGAKMLAEHWNDLDETERTDLFSSIQSSAARLQRLLNDLLTAARLESQALRLSMDTVDVTAMLAAAVTSARTMRPDAQIQLDCAPGLQVVGEQPKLAQAVDNLITNAIRHGAPPVRVACRAAGNTVEIAVSDAGPGVPLELRERLFERFATGPGRSGTGLGLFIVRELARAHSGDAWYAPLGGRGGEFVLSLPAATPPVP